MRCPKALLRGWEEGERGRATPVSCLEGDLLEERVHCTVLLQRSKCHFINVCIQNVTLSSTMLLKVTEMPSDSTE